MKNKKLLKRSLGVLCVALCLVMLFAACRNTEPSQTPTEAPTEPETTLAPTEPETTEPETTEPETTEPETTEPETTEAPTEPSGDGGSINNGTGGGYNPGGTDTNIPEPTEPEVVIPAAGSQQNAYLEAVNEKTGSFTTVVIPAGQTVYYRLQTPGTYLQVEATALTVTYNETQYQPQEGKLELQLPADGTQLLSLQFTNTGDQDQAFAVKILDALGTKDNPICIDSVEQILASLEAGDADGIYYSWTATEDGLLRLFSENTDGSVTVKGETVRLSENEGNAAISVSAGDPVLIQAVAYPDGDGNYPAVEAQMGGYLAKLVSLQVDQIPSQHQSVAIPGGKSVVYRITGQQRVCLRIADSQLGVLYENQVYTPDQQGLLQLDLPLSGSGITLELLNASTEEKTVTLNFLQPVGHADNPQVLTQLEALQVQIPEDLEGYYYSYTAPCAGIVSFQVTQAPAIENVTAQILVENLTTQSSAVTEELDGEPAQVQVSAGDQVTIYVSVLDSFGYPVYTQLGITGTHYGTQTDPIIVGADGFTANVPAGATVYYLGQGMDEAVLTLTGADMTVSHDGQDYPSDGTQLSFAVVTDEQGNALFAITNTGAEAGTYTASLAYPVGHKENMDQLTISENTVTRQEGQSAYYYRFEVPRSGTLTFTFDPTAQWSYGVEITNRGDGVQIYNSATQPIPNVCTLSVKARETVVIWVNTYDPQAPETTPAGTVTFQTSYISGPSDVLASADSATASLIPGEGMLVTGNFYGKQLVISNAYSCSASYNGQSYTPDSSGVIRIEFPATGTEALSFTVFNNTAANRQFTLLVGSNQLGTATNPETITVGTHQMVQDTVNGDAYYYKFVADQWGVLELSFAGNVECVYSVNNGTLRYTYRGQTTHTINVRPGAVVTLMVNSFDERTNKNPIGTVTFTVDCYRP